MIQKFESFIQGGASKPPTLPAVAKRHNITFPELSAPSLYKEIGKDNGEGEGEELKESYYDGDADFYREIDYDDNEQLFDFFITLPFFSILTPKRQEDKLKSDKWVVRTLDIPEEYLLQVTFPDSEIEMEADGDSVINYATDLLNDPSIPKTSQDWLDLETDLAPIDTKEIVNELIDALESYLSPGYDYDREFRGGEYHRKHTNSKEAFNKNSARKAIHFLDNYTP